MSSWNSRTSSWPEDLIFDLIQIGHTVGISCPDYMCLWTTSRGRTKCLAIWFIRLRFFMLLSAFDIFFSYFINCSVTTTSIIRWYVIKIYLLLCIVKYLYWIIALFIILVFCQILIFCHLIISGELLWGHLVTVRPLYHRLETLDILRLIPEQPIDLINLKYLTIAFGVIRRHPHIILLSTGWRYPSRCLVEFPSLFHTKILLEHSLIIICLLSLLEVDSLIIWSTSSVFIVQIPFRLLLALTCQIV